MGFGAALPTGAAFGVTGEIAGNAAGAGGVLRLADVGEVEVAGGASTAFADFAGDADTVVVPPAVVPEAEGAATVATFFFF